jgi:hypothetical protein
MKIPIRASQKKQRGRQFDMPALTLKYEVSQSAIGKAIR